MNYEKLECLYSVIKSHNNINRLIRLIENDDDETALINSKNYRGKTLLMHACQHGFNEAVEYLIRKNPSNINDVSSDGLTALMYGAMNGHAECIDRLLSLSTCDVSHCSSNNMNALMYAAYYGHYRIIERLITAGIDYNINNAYQIAMDRRHYRTALRLRKYYNINDDLSLMVACETVHMYTKSSTNINLVKNMLDEYGNEGILSYQDDFGMTALMYACMRKNNNEYVKLLRFGNIKHTNIYGYTALMLSAQYGHHEYIEILLDDDVNEMNDVGLTALLLASLYGHAKCVKLLVDNHADINHQMVGGWNAIMLATLIDNVDIVEVLLEKHANVLMKNKRNKTVANIAVTYERFGVGTLLYEYPFERKGDVLRPYGNAEAKRALANKDEAIQIVKNNDIENYERLLETYADILDINDWSGNSLLVLGAINNSLECVKRSVEGGIIMSSCNNNGYNALISAAGSGHLEIVQYCIRIGSDINARASYGWTALIAAAFAGHVEICGLLLHIGADMSLKDTSGRDARMLAEEQGHIKVEALLDNWNTNATDMVALKQDSNTGNDVMNLSYKNVVYRDINGRVEEHGDPFDEFQQDRSYEFDDGGGEFIFLDVFGVGVSTISSKIAMNRKPKLMKQVIFSYNNECKYDINDVRAFGGSNIYEDYMLYVKAMQQDDPDPDTLNEWFESLCDSFNDLDIRKYNGQMYVLNPLFNVERVSCDSNRDLLRFGYIYYLLQALKIAHCDVAPRNVLVTYEGPVLLLSLLSVKFQEINLNPLPNDVTPAYYMNERGGHSVRRDHDTKGFYMTACQYFDVNMDSNILKELDEKNRYDFKALFFMHQV